MMHSLCLAGNHYSLRFTVNALCNLEEKTGMSLAHLQETSFSCIRGLLWCALLHENPALSLSDAGNLLEHHLKSGGNLQEIANALAAALEDACFFYPAGQDQAMNP